MTPTDTIYTFDDLKASYERYILKPQDRKLIEDAYEFAKERHAGQKRRSGEP